MQTLLKTYVFFMQANGWVKDKLQEFLPEAIVEHAIKILRYDEKPYLRNNPWRLKTSLGKFIIRCSWKKIRQRRLEIDDHDCI